MIIGELILFLSVITIKPVKSDVEVYISICVGENGFYMLSKRKKNRSYVLTT